MTDHKSTVEGKDPGISMEDPPHSGMDAKEESLPSTKSEQADKLEEAGFLQRVENSVFSFMGFGSHSAPMDLQKGEKVEEVVEAPTELQEDEKFEDTKEALPRAESDLWEKFEDAKDALTRAESDLSEKYEDADEEVLPREESEKGEKTAASTDLEKAEDAKEEPVPSTEYNPGEKVADAAPTFGERGYNFEDSKEDTLSIAESDQEEEKIPDAHAAPRELSQAETVKDAKEVAPPSIDLEQGEKAADEEEGPTELKHIDKVTEADEAPTELEQTEKVGDAEDAPQAGVEAKDLETTEEDLHPTKKPGLLERVENSVFSFMGFGSHSAEQPSAVESQEPAEIPASGDSSAKEDPKKEESPGTETSGETLSSWDFADSEEIKGRTEKAEEKSESVDPTPSEESKAAEVSQREVSDASWDFADDVELKTPEEAQDKQPEETAATLDPSPSEEKTIPEDPSGLEQVEGINKSLDVADIHEMKATDDAQNGHGEEISPSVDSTPNDELKIGEKELPEEMFQSLAVDSAEPKTTETPREGQRGEMSNSFDPKSTETAREEEGAETFRSLDATDHENVEGIQKSQDVADHEEGKVTDDAQIEHGEGDLHPAKKPGFLEKVEKSVFSFMGLGSKPTTVEKHLTEGMPTSSDSPAHAEPEHSEVAKPEQAEETPKSLDLPESEEKAPEVFEKEKLDGSALSVDPTEGENIKIPEDSEREHDEETPLTSLDRGDKEEVKPAEDDVKEVGGEAQKSSNFWSSGAIKATGIAPLVSPILNKEADPEVPKNEESEETLMARDLPDEDELKAAETPEISMKKESEETTLSREFPQDDEIKALSRATPQEEKGEEISNPFDPKSTETAEEGEGGELSKSFDAKSTESTRENEGGETSKSLDPTDHGNVEEIQKSVDATDHEEVKATDDGQIEHGEEDLHPAKKPGFLGKVEKSVFSFMGFGSKPRTVEKQLPEETPTSSDSPTKAEPEHPEVAQPEQAEEIPKSLDLPQGEEKAPEIFEKEKLDESTLSVDPIEGEDTKIAKESKKGQSEETPLTSEELRHAEDPVQEDGGKAQESLNFLSSEAIKATGLASNMQGEESSSSVAPTLHEEPEISDFLENKESGETPMARVFQDKDELKAAETPKVPVTEENEESTISKDLPLHDELKAAETPEVPMTEETTLLKDLAHDDELKAPQAPEVLEEPEKKQSEETLMARDFPAQDELKDAESPVAPMTDEAEDTTVSTDFPHEDELKDPQTPEVPEVPEEEQHKSETAEEEEGGQIAKTVDAKSTVTAQEEEGEEVSKSFDPKSTETAREGGEISKSLDPTDHGNVEEIEKSVDDTDYEEVKATDDGQIEHGEEDLHPAKKPGFLERMENNVFSFMGFGSKPMTSVGSADKDELRPAEDAIRKGGEAQKSLVFGAGEDMKATGIASNMEGEEPSPSVAPTLHEEPEISDFLKNEEPEETLMARGLQHKDELKASETREVPEDNEETTISKDFPLDEKLKAAETPEDPMTDEAEETMREFYSFLNMSEEFPQDDELNVPHALEDPDVPEKEKSQESLMSRDFPDNDELKAAETPEVSLKEESEEATTSKGFPDNDELKTPQDPEVLENEQSEETLIDRDFPDKDELKAAESLEVPMTEDESEQPKSTDSSQEEEETPLPSAVDSEEAKIRETPQEVKGGDMSNSVDPKSTETAEEEEGGEVSKDFDPKPTETSRDEEGGETSKSLDTTDHVNVGEKELPEEMFHSLALDSEQLKSRGTPQRKEEIPQSSAVDSEEPKTAETPQEEDGGEISKSFNPESTDSAREEKGGETSKSLDPTDQGNVEEIQNSVDGAAHGEVKATDDAQIEHGEEDLNPAKKPGFVERMENSVFSFMGFGSARTSVEKQRPEEAAMSREFSDNADLRAPKAPTDAQEETPSFVDPTEMEKMKSSETSEKEQPDELPIPSMNTDNDEAHSTEAVQNEDSREIPSSLDSAEKGEDIQKSEATKSSEIHERGLSKLSLDVAEEDSGVSEGPRAPVSINAPDKEDEKYTEGQKEGGENPVSLNPTGNIEPLAMKPAEETQTPVDATDNEDINAKESANEEVIATSPSVQHPLPHHESSVAENLSKDQSELQSSESLTSWDLLENDEVKAAQREEMSSFVDPGEGKEMTNAEHSESDPSQETTMAPAEDEVKSTVDTQETEEFQKSADVAGIKESKAIDINPSHEEVKEILKAVGIANYEPSKTAAADLNESNQSEDTAHKEETEADGGEDAKDSTILTKEEDSMKESEDTSNPKEAEEPTTVDEIPAAGMQDREMAVSPPSMEAEQPPKADAEEQPRSFFGIVLKSVDKAKKMILPEDPEADPASNAVEPPKSEVTPKSAELEKVDNPSEESAPSKHTEVDPNGAAEEIPESQAQDSPESTEHADKEVPAALTEHTARDFQESVPTLPADAPTHKSGEQFPTVPADAPTHENGEQFLAVGDVPEDIPADDEEDAKELPNKEIPPTEELKEPESETTTGAGEELQAVPTAEAEEKEDLHNIPTAGVEEKENFLDIPTTGAEEIEKLHDNPKTGAEEEEVQKNPTTGSIEKEELHEFPTRGAEEASQMSTMKTEASPVEKEEIGGETPRKVGEESALGEEQAEETLSEEPAISAQRGLSVKLGTKASSEETPRGFEESNTASPGGTPLMKRVEQLEQKDSTPISPAQEESPPSILASGIKESNGGSKEPTEVQGREWSPQPVEAAKAQEVPTESRSAEPIPPAQDPVKMTTEENATANSATPGKQGEGAPLMADSPKQKKKKTKGKFTNIILGCFSPHRHKHSKDKAVSTPA